MTQAIHRIQAGINCALLDGGEGHVLIDTGPMIARRRLLRGLAGAGCGPGDLKLVIVTHSDMDHTGSCAYLRRAFGTQIASHEAEAGILKTGARVRNRKARPDRAPWYFRALLPLARLFGEGQPLASDLLLEDGQSLSPYGLDAKVLHLPGHSRGSLAILTDTGELFCGDLFWNTRRPRLHPLIDDVETARASVERLKTLPIRAIYPAHGKFFPIEEMPDVPP